MPKRKLPTPEEFMLSYDLKDRPMSSIRSEIEVAEQLRDEHFTKCDGFIIAMNGYLSPYKIRVGFQRGRVVAEYLSYREVGGQKKRLNFEDVFDQINEYNIDEEDLNIILTFEKLRLSLNAMNKIRAISVETGRSHLAGRSALKNIRNRDGAEL